MARRLLPLTPSPKRDYQIVHFTLLYTENFFMLLMIASEHSSFLKDIFSDQEKQKPIHSRNAQMKKKVSLFQRSQHHQASTSLFFCIKGARRKIWRPLCLGNTCHSNSKDHNIPFRALACPLRRLLAPFHHRWSSLPPSLRLPLGPRLHCPTDGAEGLVGGAAVVRSLDCQLLYLLMESQNCLSWLQWVSVESRTMHCIIHFFPDCMQAL